MLGTKKHVLVVDDDNFIQQAMKFMLTSLKAEFTIVGNGEDACKVYSEKSSSIYLILMDLQMPKIDGFDTTKKIREYETANKITPVKIIALSGDSDEATKKKCSLYGMNTLLKKPIKKDELAKVLQASQRG